MRFLAEADLAELLLEVGEGESSGSSSEAAGRSRGTGDFLLDGGGEGTTAVEERSLWLAELMVVEGMLESVVDAAVEKRGLLAALG